jgi:ABC-type sugar transport system ATPase subunit
MAIGDEVGVMKDGKLLEKGPPREIYDKPRKTFTAWFIGNPGMNLIHVNFRKGALEEKRKEDGFIPSAILYSRL